MENKAKKPSDIEIQQIRDMVFQVAEPLLPSEFFLLAVDFEKEAGRWYLRLYMEGKGFHISLSDCEALSHLIEEPLEQMACLTPFSYSLEVSSPGAFRELKTDRELDFFQGRQVLLQPLEPEANPDKIRLKGQKKTASSRKPDNAPGLSGILAGYDPQTRMISLQSMPGMDAGEASIQSVCLKDALYRVMLDSPLDLPSPLTLSPEMV